MNCLTLTNSPMVGVAPCPGSKTAMVNWLGMMVRVMACASSLGSRTGLSVYGFWWLSSSYLYLW